MIKRVSRSLLCFILLFFAATPFFAEFYWETASPISNVDTRFPSTASYGNTSIVVWEEVEASSGGGNIWLSAQVSYDTGGTIDSVPTLKTISRFAGPFVYSGEVPNLFSVAINSQGTIAVAVQSSVSTISVYTSQKHSFTFTEQIIPKGALSLVGPRIFRTSDDGFMIFATQGDNESFQLMSTRSSTGSSWDSFSRFAPTQNIPNTFLPVLSITTGNREIVAFQAFYNAGNRMSYQLYSTYTDNAGISWSEPQLLTHSVSSNQDFTNYHNQRPFLFYDGQITYIAWERSYYTSENSIVCVAPLSNTGLIDGRIEEISPANANAKQPVLFSLNGKLSLVWYDSRRGSDSIYLAQKTGLLWTEERLSTGSLNAYFACPLIINYGQDFHVFWEQKRANGSSRVTRLSLDRTVAAPIMEGITFQNGQRSTGSQISVAIKMPEDSSGIAGYSWVITQNPDMDPISEFMEFPSTNRISVSIPSDGMWYFKTRALDMAGNWSDPSVVTYYKDTTPPVAPILTPLITEDTTFLPSNDFQLEWVSGDPSDVIAGYSYNLQYIASLDAYFQNPDLYTESSLLEIKQSVSPRVMTKDTQQNYLNRDNGVYVFSVAAIDTVGNIGPATQIPVYLNKYIPYTIITSINQRTDDFGNMDITLLGKGFTYDGIVSAIYIDSDGVSPYDRELFLNNQDFTIYSDQRIGNIKISDLEEGTYRVGLLHTDRGLYMSRGILPVTEYGTVKKGDYSYTFKPSWKLITQRYKYTVQISDVLLWVVFALSFIGLIVSVRGIALTAKEGILVQKEVRALITGDVMPLVSKEKTKNFKKRGLSLRYKMVMFTSSLVITIILLVSIPLGIMMVNTQEETLAKGLEDRVSVLLDSLSTGVKAYMPSQNILELSFLPNQSNSMEEALYTTILGLPSSGINTNLDYVWASNDSSITDKIDSAELNYGVSRLTGEDITQIGNLCNQLNDTAVERVTETARGISELTTEGISLSLRNDEKSVERRDEIQSIISQLTERLTTELDSLSKEGVGSFPEYNSTSLSRENTTYLFYKPVLYRQGSEQTFVRGIVLVEIDTQELLSLVENATKNIIQVAFVIALLALFIGIIGSLTLASIIIRPIRRLAEHVQMIRNTGDKTELEGKDIIIKSNDEIGLLGENVNDMTHGLVEAAVYENMLLGGKEVQRAFLPLDMIDEVSKVKLSVGHLETDQAQFFGYYEGAKGVSGDYFDYKALDDKHYAIIKCDVSGKGSPAALIMAEVAALFCDYLKNWTFKKNGYDLSPLVYKINDHLESRNLKGKFAAFTLAIFDSVSGDLHFCNAGDNLIHIYDASEKKKKTITLPETPASGSFPSFLVEMKGGFPVKKIHLNPGDVLFLYTDGIEEAKRLYRDENYKPVRYRPGSRDLIVDLDDKDALDGEEMSPERVNGIIESIFAKKVYRLVKQETPISVSPEVFEFDFTTCEGSAEEVIMALVAVEKVFRMWKAPFAIAYDHVVIDKKVDTFLKSHFLQYEMYCGDSAEHPTPELKNEYMYYTHVKEDEQFDDLTLVAIKKK